MKKVISLLLVFAFAFCMTQFAWAHTISEEELIPAGGNDRVTVYVEKNLPKTVQDRILAYFLSGDARENEQTRNILCTLFGHKNTTSTSVTVTHNVYTTSPKCVKDTYTTYTCTRCGNVETVLTDSIRISTCHG